MSALNDHVDLTFDDDTLIGHLVWLFGVCSLVTETSQRRVPELDTTDPMVLELFAWNIEHGDPSGVLEFLWEGPEALAVRAAVQS